MRVAYLLIALSACSSGGSAKKPALEPKAPAAPAEPETPPAVLLAPLTPEAKAELLGPDADANGVRDDVDVYVAQNLGTTETTAKAGVQMAQAIQSLLGAEREPEAAKAVMKEYLHALDCAEVTFGEDWFKVNEALLDATIDTEARTTQYFLAQQSFSGQVLGRPTLEEMKAGCK